METGVFASEKFNHPGFRTIRENVEFGRRRAVFEREPLDHVGVVFAFEVEDGEDLLRIVFADVENVRSD